MSNVTTDTESGIIRETQLAAALVIYPDDDLVVAFLSNSQEGAAFDIRRIGELFYQRTDDKQH